MVDHELRKRVAAEKTILGSLAQEHALGKVDAQRIFITDVAVGQIGFGEAITPILHDVHRVQPVFVVPALYVATSDKTLEAGPSPGEAHDVFVIINLNCVALFVELGSSVLVEHDEAGREELCEWKGKA